MYTEFHSSISLGTPKGAGSFICDPTLIAIGSLVIGVGSNLLKHKANTSSVNKANAANAAAATLSMTEASKDISLLELQQGQASGRTIYEADRQARSTQALARVSAGEAGVTGVSVEALLGDIDKKLGEFKTAESKNLDMAIDQLQREKISGRTIAQSRITATHQERPSVGALGISLAATGLDFWAGQIFRNTNSSKTAKPAKSA